MMAGYTVRTKQWSSVKKRLKAHMWPDEAVEFVANNLSIDAAKDLCRSLSKDTTTSKRRYFLKATRLTICEAGAFQDGHVISYLRIRMRAKNVKETPYSIAEALASRVCAWGERLVTIKVEYNER